MEILWEEEVFQFGLIYESFGKQLLQCMVYCFYKTQETSILCLSCGQGMVEQF